MCVSEVIFLSPVETVGISVSWVFEGGLRFMARASPSSAFLTLTAVSDHHSFCFGKRRFLMFKDHFSPQAGWSALQAVSPTGTQSFRSGLTEEVVRGRR